MKQVCHALGIRAPAFVMVTGEADLARTTDQLRFPMIVKHPNSYASIDLTAASRVTSVGELEAQVTRMVERHGSALVEEFIEGTECTVLVAENPSDPFRPTTYQPVQYVFPPGESFKHHDMKWVDYDRMTCIPIEDPALDQQVREVAAQFFVGLGSTSFGRVDIRVDDHGHPYVLEMNANCGVFYEPEDAGGADLCLLHDPAGHEGFARPTRGSGVCPAQAKRLSLPGARRA